MSYTNLRISYKYRSKMKKSALVSKMKANKSVLCVGLDTDIHRIPSFIKENYEDPIYEFNRRIIESTKDICVAYKFNIAFYEAQGISGWESLEKSLALIPSDIFTIADAKRGDIGNTSKLYARTFFETYNFDSITVSPYMGRDSLEPFYGYDDKWVIILGLTSNAGSADCQMLTLDDGRKVYEEVIDRCATYGDDTNTMFVVGATKTDYIKSIREKLPNHFFLMPGIGKQGGDLDAAMNAGLNDDYGLLINSSRGIIYASDTEDYDQAARASATKLNGAIEPYLK